MWLSFDDRAKLDMKLTNYSYFIILYHRFKSIYDMMTSFSLKTIFCNLREQKYITLHCIKIRERIIVPIHWCISTLKKTYLGALWQPIGIQTDVWTGRCLNKSFKPQSTWSNIGMFKLRPYSLIGGCLNADDWTLQTLACSNIGIQ